MTAPLQATTLTTTAVTASPVLSSYSTTILPGTQQTIAQGVSSLSNIFGEPVKQLSSTNLNSNLSSQYSNLTNNNVSSINSSSGINQTNSSNSSTGLTSQIATLTNTNDSNENNAMIIANDIETDKLLNVIEKSKGFQDSKSTTARRLRNKPIALTSLAGIINNNNNYNNADETSNSNLQGNNNMKKINKLIWNQEKLEVEYRDKEEEEEEMTTLNSSNTTDQQQFGTPSNNINTPNNTPCTIQLNTNNKQTSPNRLLKRQNSGEVIKL